MNALLDKSQMKFVYAFRTAIIVLSVCSLAVSLWLITVAKSFQDLSIMFSLIFGACCLLNVYRFNKMLKINNGKVSPFQIKCCLLALGRGVFISLTYLCIVLHDTRQSIGFAAFTLFIIIAEILLRHTQAKKINKL